MSVLSYLQSNGDIDGEDLDGMPAYMPGRASDAGTLTTNYSISVNAPILAFVEGLAGKKAERSNYSPSEMFCPGRLAKVFVASDDTDVLVDFVEGWNGQMIAVPVKLLTEEEAQAAENEWDDFFAAREARKSARWEEPVAIVQIDDERWRNEGAFNFSPPDDSLDSLLFLVGSDWLLGVVVRRGDKWRFTDARALLVGLAVEHGVLANHDATNATSRQAFVDAAAAHGVSMGLLELHRLTESVPELAAVAREAALTGLLPEQDLDERLRGLRERLAKAVPATDPIPAEKQIIDAARTAVAELEHAVAVVEGMRVAREHYGIDIAGERAGAVADLEARIAEATAKRDTLNAELKSLGGKKGSRAQALARAAAELAALQERREAMKAEVAAEERQAQDAIAKVRATVDAEVAKVSAEVQRQVADLEARRVELTEAVSALAARVGALDDTPPQEDDEVPVLALTDPTDLTRALEAQGLRYAPAWPTRFLVAALAARRVGSLLLLAGPTGTGKTRLVRQVAGLLEGSGQHTIPVRPEWLAASDLLGYVDPIRDTFAPTDFVAAVREATVTDFRNAASGDAPDAPVPWFLLLDELNLARVENFGADLLSALDAPGGDPARVLRLFPEDVRTGWLREWNALKERGDLDARETGRADLLGRMFDPGAHRQTGAADAHLLTLPPNLVVCGTLNTDRHTHELSPKVFDRSFVLQMPAPSLDEVLRKGGAAAFAEGASLARYRLPDPPAGVDPLSTTPELLDGFQRAIEALRPTGLMPSFRLARNARAYLAEAAAWPGLGSDTGRLLGDLVHLLLLPRLDCSADAARQALQALTEVTRSWGNADLDRELIELRARADDARHGDFRGLA